MAKLIALTGQNKGTAYPLGELCVIGRGQDAQIRLLDQAVSRQHAKITRREGAYVLEDLESSRGVQVNGAKVSAARLHPGDEVAFPGCRLRFQDRLRAEVHTADFKLRLPPGLTPRVQGGPTATIPDGAATLVEPGPDPLDGLMELARRACELEDLAALTREVADSCLALLPAADRVFVALTDHPRQRLDVSALSLRRAGAHRCLALSGRITREVLARGRAALSRARVRVKATDGATEEVLLHRLAAPLTARGHTLGLLCADHLGPGEPFGDAELALMRGAGSLASLALYSARMQAVVERQSRTEQALSSAREVQKRFLPRGLPRVQGLTFLAHYEPCHDVGGDLYDFIPLDSSRVAIVVGDVAGKGFAAALVMAWVTSQLRLAAHQTRHPAEVLDRLNRALLETRQHDLFVTLFYGVLDRWNMTLTFCNAGHMPLLVRRAGPAGEGASVERVDGEGGLPVGMLEAGYEQGRLTLAQGDSVLLFSDGVTEARDAAGELYGMARLQAALEQGAAATSNLVDDVLRDLRRFVGDQPQADDITLVGFRVGSDSEDIRSTLPVGATFPQFSG